MKPGQLSSNNQKDMDHSFLINSDLKERIARAEASVFQLQAKSKWGVGKSIQISWVRLRQTLIHITQTLVHLYWKAQIFFHKSLYTFKKIWQKVQMCFCISVCVCVCICMCVCVCAFVCVCHVNVLVYLNVYMCISTYASVCEFVCECSVYSCVFMSEFLIYKWNTVVPQFSFG